MTTGRRILAAELIISLAAKAVALAAIGLLLFLPADRPQITSAVAGVHMLGALR